MFPRRVKVQNIWSLKYFSFFSSVTTGFTTIFLQSGALHEGKNGGKPNFYTNVWLSDFLLMFLLFRSMITYICSWNYHCNLLNFFLKYELANRIPNAPYIRLPYVDWTQPPPKTPDPNLIPRQTKHPESYTSIPLQVTRLNLPQVFSVPPNPMEIPQHSHRFTRNRHPMQSNFQPRN